MRALLISNGQQTGMPYLEHARSSIQKFVGGRRRRIVIVPYASVVEPYDACVRALDPIVRGALGAEPIGLHTVAQKDKAIREADAIFVRGGNTWQLLKMLRTEGLIEAFRGAAMGGTPYVGWSAGANIACPTIQTTNDMPIADPAGFEALGLVPFQINPHYVDGHPDGHNGESREMRLREYIEVNRHTYVVGLREGLMLQVDDGAIGLLGDKMRSARVIRYGMEPLEVQVGDDCAFLMGDRYSAQ